MRLYNLTILLIGAELNPMSQPFKLYRLQQIDSQLDQARTRLREIEITLADDSALKKAQSKAQAVKAELETARKALHRAEESVRTQRVKIEQTDATLYGGKVRNPKELQDLQNEAEALRRYLSVLEDRQLEAMIHDEDKQAVFSEASTSLSLVQAKRNSEIDAMNLEHEACMQEIDRLESERSAAAEAIPEEDIKLYETLRKQRRGVAVARLVDKTCSACGSTLSAAQLHGAKLLTQIIRCDSCSRILYGGS